MTVLDASVFLQLSFREQYTKQAQYIFEETDTLEAPALLWYEIGSGLVKLTRRKLISQSDATKYFKLLTSIPVTIIETDRARTLELALELGLSYYDASYVNVAMKSNTELYTADELLANRASDTVNVIHLNRV